MSWWKVILEPILELYAVFFFASAIPLVFTIPVLIGAVVQTFRKRPSSELRIWYICALLAPILFVVLQIPSCVVQAELVGRPVKEAVITAAPNGSQVLTMRLHLTYPRSEFIDPKVVLVARLEDREGTVVAAENVVVSEISDYDDPVVSWESDRVVLAKFDSDMPERVIVLRATH